MAESRSRRERVKTVRIIARLNVGGPARHVVIADHGMAARGHQTLLVHGAVAPGEASLEHAARDAGIRVRMVPELGPRISLFSDLRALSALIRVVFSEAPDVIHTHTAKGGALGRVSAAIFNATRPARKRAVVVHTFHGHVLTGYFGRTGSAAVRMAERTLARVTDWIVTISPSQKRDIGDRLHVARESKVVVIPLGLDLQALLNQPRESSHIRERLGLNADDVVFGFVGRFVPIKDLGTLILAFARAAAVVPRAQLVLFGDGPRRAEIGALVHREGIAHKVHFEGWSDDLVSVYAAIDVCVLSSLNEGTPVALIEAMAAEKAVVSTAVGGVPDIVDDGRTGLLVPPGDASRLSAALIAVAEDPELRSRLGRAAREDVASRFSPVRLVDDLERLYTAGLERKRGRIPPTP